MVTGLFAATVFLHLLSNGKPVALEKPLRDFPIVVGSWQGQDVPVDQSILTTVGVDEYLNRIYKQPASPEGLPIFLYIGYYRTQRTGEGIHSPKNCLPGAGWQPENKRVLQLQTAAGGTASVNLYVVQKGLDRAAVIYWYQSHGRIVASEYWAKIYLVVDTIRYHRTDAALVRIVTPIGKDPQTTFERVTAFALQTVAPLQSILPL
jgi:EpsI family protein